MIFSKKILAWYKLNKRDLPWRQTLDPYKIWLSEVMLQQTRVAQGLPYYLEFVKAFPTVFDMAQASEEQLLKLWQGLGYYSRARNMHAAAKMVVSDYGGKFPATYKEIIKLKGVGDYTASAIASICFGEPCPVVDGNVYRVLSRFFGVAIPINSTEGVKYFKNLAQELIATDNIRDYNQGIMEFGAIQCTPKNPDCSSCPLQSGCVALDKQQIGLLPVKLKKLKVKHRFFNYLVFLDPSGQTGLEQRSGKGIWQGLYQFPLLETTQLGEEAEIQAHLKKAFPQLGVTGFSLYNNKVLVHKLTHQHLHTRFWMVQLNQPLKEGLSWSAVETYPVPVLVADFIKAFKKELS